MPDAEELREQQAFYDSVMKKFGGHCVVCYPDADLGGVTVHEIIPRSKLPHSWWKDINNGCPLCNVHHDQVHNQPAAGREQYCRIHIRKYLASRGGLK